MSRRPLHFVACMALSIWTATAADSGFLPTRSFSSVPSEAAPAGMVWIPGGEFSMGGDAPDAQPIHRVIVSGFWMDVTEVTNAAFARFVAATGYVTVAEQAPSPKDFPGVAPELLVPGAAVFTPPREAANLDDPLHWWRYQPGADWRHPLGPESDLRGRDNYPVVQIAYPDAAAYARWAGKRLPTEAEWEFAARGGLVGQRYSWGNELRPRRQWMANTYQGQFPTVDTAQDGHAGLAPVGLYPPNAYGLHDMAGNAWEWCSDWYRPDAYTVLLQKSTAIQRDPTGPSAPPDSTTEAARVRVQRGGSYLCSSSYCVRYEVGSRSQGDENSAACHLGFRCVADAGSSPR